MEVLNGVTAITTGYHQQGSIWCGGVVHVVFTVPVIVNVFVVYPCLCLLAIVGERLVVVVWVVWIVVIFVLSVLNSLL